MRFRPRPRRRWKRGSHQGSRGPDVRVSAGGEVPRGGSRLLLPRRAPRQPAAVRESCAVLRGVPYHLLAEQKGSVEEPEKKMLQKALYFHDQQRNCADTIGKFVAHLNMGICYASLGEEGAS